MNRNATTTDFPRAIVAILAVVILLSASVAAQTPEEHARHHLPTDPNGPVDTQNVGGDSLGPSKEHRFVVGIRMWF